jgi:hypothetical protein
MADDADRAFELEEEHRQQSLAKVEPFTLLKGRPGECDTCGEHSMRLIDGMCAPCRDRYKPRAW